jgi:ribonuclease VapC
MFLDSSAIVEYFITGPEFDRIASAFSTANTRFCTSGMVMFETTTVLASRRQIEVSEAYVLLNDLLLELRAEIMPITDETASAAIDAFSRYGKGRHPAKLNFGDCFSYAGAKFAGVPLLYVGGDFALTDLG